MDTHATRKVSLGGRVGDALLTLAAVGGVVCIGLVLVAFFFHITLIMFKTGSMSPTIPAGSLAVVKQIPAADIRVGDVVTVDRSPAPPITHRVTSVAPAAGDARTITLRGDANQVDDPAPYVVKTVRIVLFSVPQLAYVVNAVSNPLALAGITIGAACLVTWAFWPRGGGAPRSRRRPPQDATTVGRRAVVVLLAASASVLASPTCASAAETEDVIHGSVLTLTSVGDKTLMAHLMPAATATWQVGIAAHPTDPGIVRISLTSTGGLVADPNGLQVTVSACDVRWVDGACPGGGTVLLGPGPASALLAGSVELTSMSSNDQRWIRVEASLPAHPVTLPTGSATLVLTASGVGDVVSAGGSVDRLANTGADWWPSLLAAPFAVAVGLSVVSLARWVGDRQRRRDEASP